MDNLEHQVEMVMMDNQENADQLEHQAVMATQEHLVLMDMMVLMAPQEPQAMMENQELPVHLVEMVNQEPLEQLGLFVLLAIQMLEEVDMHQGLHMMPEAKLHVPLHAT